MSSFPFPHDGRVYVIADDQFEIAYYSRGYFKFKRVRQISFATWEETFEQSIDYDHFYMVAACIERGKVRRHGLA